MNIARPPLPLPTAFAEQARSVEATVRALDTAAAKAETMATSLSAQVVGFPRTPLDDVTRTVTGIQQ